MINVKIFREQHGELLSIAAKITQLLHESELANDAAEVKKLFANLLGKLAVHLSLEDEWLYPKLLESPDENVRTVARKFVDEMGCIGQVVTDYKDKWIITSSAIQKNPAEFIQETNAIFDALSKRIEAENNELYKIVDGA